MENSKNQEEKNIRSVCIFGLSGDPPTGNGGHMGIVSSISSMTKKIEEREVFCFHEVRVIPVFRHMFASKRNKLSTFDNRLEMCKLTFHDIPRVVVSSLEREIFEDLTEGKSDQEKMGVRIGTADVFDALKKKEPETKFTLALGLDTFMNLTDGKWRRWKDVISHVDGRILVIQRDFSLVVDASTSTRLKTVHSRTDAEVSERIEKLNEEWCPHHQRESTDKIEAHPVNFIRVPSLTSISSTAIRLTKDISFLNSSLKPSVVEYIVAKQLYAFSEDDESNL